MNCWREDQTTDVVEDPIIWALRCPAVRTLNFRRKLPPGASWGLRQYAGVGFCPVRSCVKHSCRFGVNQFCRFTSSAWPRCWAALVR